MLWLFVAWDVLKSYVTDGWLYLKRCWEDYR
jgi:hypothetical protein